MKNGCSLLCSFLLLLTLIPASSGGLVNWIATRNVYQPTKSPPSSLKNVYINTKDGEELNLIVLPYRDSSALTTILYFHGNGGNMYSRVSNAKQMQLHLKANMVLVDYRGFGNSTCKTEPSDDGLYLDAEATLDYVMTRPDLNYTKVVLFGRSLGGAVAVRLASVNPHRVAAIIVENTFLSIPHVASSHSSGLLSMRLLSWACGIHQFPSYQHVAQCHMPSLFVSGLLDKVIAPEMMEQLYELSPAQNKILARFPEGTHMNTPRCQGYFPALAKFIKDVV